MNHSKKSQLIISIVIFVLTGLILITNVFNVSINDYKNYPFDYAFHIVLTILFWYSSAYILNYLISSFFWSRIFKIPIGKTSLEWLKEFTSSILYTVATALILINAFWIELNSFWLTILILLLLVQMAVRPKFLSLFPKEAFARAKPFNVGDWISIKNKNGDVIITGEVYSISRSAVFIKNEDNNLTFVSMVFLADSIIENYSSVTEYSRFKTKLCIDHNVPVDRVKRILLAAVEQVIQEKKLFNVPQPKVLITDINETGIDYEILFWIKPWEEINPDELKDILLTTVLKNLSHSGIYPAYQKNDVFVGTYQRKFTDIDLLEDRKKILRNVDLLKFLNEEELNTLAANIITKVYKKDETIIKEGESGESMFILVEGLLNVYVKNNEGKEVYVGSLKPGDFLGEMSLLTGEPRSATVIAKSDSLTFELTKEIISPIIHNRVNLTEEFGKIIAERHSINIDKIAESQFKAKSKIEVFIEKIKSFFNL